MKKNRNIYLKKSDQQSFGSDSWMINSYGKANNGREQNNFQRKGQRLNSKYEKKLHDLENGANEYQASSFDFNSKKNFEHPIRALNNFHETIIPDGKQFFGSDFYGKKNDYDESQKERLFHRKNTNSHSSYDENRVNGFDDSYGRHENEGQYRKTYKTEKIVFDNRHQKEPLYETIKRYGHNQYMPSELPNNENILNEVKYEQR